MSKIDQINALTLEDVLYIVLDRILDLSGITGPAYMLDEDESLPFYDRIIVNQSLVKPPLATLEQELSDYKAELVAAENARLAEIARVKDIRDRFNAIKDIRGAINKANLSVTNPAIELERIVKEDDQVMLGIIETKAAEFDAEVAKNEVRSQRKALGRQSRLISEEILDIVAGHSIQNNLNPAQKDQMEVDFASILQALKVNRPKKAKALILAVQPDGVLVTQEMKDEILEVYSNNGL